MRKYTVRETAWIHRKSERWVRAQIGEVVPERRHPRKGSRGDELYLTELDEGALAVVAKLDEQFPFAPLARNIGMFISSLTLEQFQKAAEEDAVIVATAGGSIPAGVYKRSDVVSKRPDGRVDPILAIGARSLWEGLRHSLDAFERAHADKASALN